jgi:hypothetical protein
MVAKRKDAEALVVLACTLVPYDLRFELGRTLPETSRAVQLNHPYCRRSACSVARLAAAEA